ncbi:hypothetical protein ACVR0O_04595 [Streptococcus caviae]|uniref:hypothetical protein n=1 Tax=Streptococcus sp. 'caviae' TaxID=1915004 RepID=UPI00094BA047|nr:hypothetical protein [Streptococcus sp. 'caviae']OLN84122.1 hypothetical protein BMI76_02695 [Streptococcus sp. 'caviae']
MKKWSINIFATTGLSLLLVALVALCLGAHWLYLVSVFQVLLLNILIHLTILATHRLALTSFLWQALLDIAVIEGLTGLLGLVFNWNQWLMLVLIGLIMYAVSQILDLFDLNQEAKEINELIQKRQHR